jgi:hypothetical protein
MLTDEKIHRVGELTAELIELALNDPLRTTINADCYLADTRDRAHAIGQELNELGSFDVMLMVHDAVRAVLMLRMDAMSAGGFARGLELNWDGIGSWRG